MFAVFFIARNDRQVNRLFYNTLRGTDGRKNIVKTAIYNGFPVELARSHLNEPESVAWWAHLSTCHPARSGIGSEDEPLIARKLKSLKTDS